MEKAVTFGERLFFMAVWVLIILLLIGGVFHLSTKYGVFPGVSQWLAEHTNLSAQAGV